MISIADIRERYRGNTEPERTVRVMELAVLLLSFFVLLQLLWLGVGALRYSSITPVEPARDSLQVVSPSNTGLISGPQSMQLQSRPLFWPSRRPMVPELVEPEAVAESSESKPARRLEGLKLMGALGAGDQGAAIIDFKGKLMRLAIGDEVGGWTLQSVALGEAVFVSAGARDVRRLLPEPVVAVRNDPEPGGGEVGARDGTSGSTEEGSAEDSATDKKSEGSLSLGGPQ